MRTHSFRCGSSADPPLRDTGFPALYSLSVSSWLSSGFPLKMPHENMPWFQLARWVPEQRNDSAELRKLRAELCKYWRKELANICSNEGMELVSIAPTSHNGSCPLSWSTCTNELLFERIFRQSLLKTQANTCSNLSSYANISSDD